MRGTLFSRFRHIVLFGIFGLQKHVLRYGLEERPSGCLKASKDGPKPICCVLVKGKPLARHHIFRSRVILDLIQISITKVTASGSERVERDATLMSL